MQFWTFLILKNFKSQVLLLFDIKLSFQDRFTLFLNFHIYKTIIELKHLVLHVFSFNLQVLLRVVALKISRGRNLLINEI